MYESYFGVSEKPFSIAPDPRFVYLSPAHEEALAHLVYGVQEPGGFVLLTGEVGTGKTTLLRTLLEQLPDTVDLAMVLNPKLTPSELVATVCDELGVARSRRQTTLKQLVDALNRHLLERYAGGRRTVLVIDEAQGLSADVLEQVRLLTNLETTREKLLEIVLVGQPELRETLARQDLRQLAQRITARYHLKPLNPEEVRHYVHHRLSIAGANRRLFTDGALRRLARISGGIPRLINEVADRALLGAYAGERQVVDARLIGRAADQVFGEPLKRTPWGRWASAVAVLAGLAAGAGWWVQNGDRLTGSPVPAVGDTAAVATAQRPVVVTIQAPAPEAVSPAPARASEPVDQTQVAETPMSGTQMPDSSAEVASTAMPEPMPVPISDPIPDPAQDAMVDPNEGVAVWLSRVGPALTFEAAMAQLFEAWGATFRPGDGEPCDQALRQGLSCVYQTGDRDVLAALNRPAVLLLQTPSGESHVTVTAVNGSQVTLGSGDERREAQWGDLDPYWTENFLLLWHPPESMGGGLLRPGERGQSVLWLRDRLAAATGEQVPAAEDAEAYDVHLESAVRDFQTAHGLEADGLVGVQTLLWLTSDPALDAYPRLH